MKVRGIILAAALGVSALAGPAHAGSTFTPPKGCTGYLTVQMRGCIVSNHYRCDQDPKGDQWRVDFNDTGPFFASHIDSETRWVETYDLAAGTHEVLEPGAKAPASFSKLLETGSDSYDFSTVTDDGSVTHVVGTDRLTGVTKVQDGVKLEQTEFDTTATDDSGKLVYRAKGHEWINRDWRLFIAGTGVWEDQSGTMNYDNSPMRLSQKGQRGFMSSEPQYDCHSVMSALPNAVLPASAGR